MWILTLFSAAAALVNAIELLFKAFPGHGKVKKRTVMTAISDLLDTARKAGLEFDSVDLLGKLSQYIDDYVAIQHAAGIFTRAAGAIPEPAVQTPLDDRGVVDRS